MQTKIPAKKLESGMNLLFGGTVFYVLTVKVGPGIVTVYVRERGAKPFNFGLNQTVSVQD